MDGAIKSRERREKEEVSLCLSFVVQCLYFRGGLQEIELHSCVGRRIESNVGTTTIMRGRTLAAVLMATATAVSAQLPTQQQQQQVQQQRQQQQQEVQQQQESAEVDDNSEWKEEPCNFNFFYACAASQLWSFHKSFRSYMTVVQREPERQGLYLRDLQVSRGFFQ